MIDPTIAAWSVAAAVGILLSALYSGMETGAYSLNRVRLQVLHHERERSAHMLHRLVQNPVVLLSTLLIGNNVANYIGTAGIAVLLEYAGFNEWQMVVLNVLIVTPLLFVFGETLPKDLFAAHADKLMYRLAWVLRASEQLYKWTGLVPLVTLFSAAMMRMTGGGSKAVVFHPRRMVGQLVREGVGQGLLSDEQSAIVERVLELSDRQVKQEMIPWNKVVHVKASDDADRIWELAHTTSFTRFPVIDDAGSVVGVLNVFDGLMEGREKCPTVGEIMRPAYTLSPQTPLRASLRRLQEQRRGMAVIINPETKKPVGVVTIKDLVEPITGELASW